MHLEVTPIRLKEIVPARIRLITFEKVSCADYSQMKNETAVLNAIHFKIIIEYIIQYFSFLY